MAKDYEQIARDRSAEQLDTLRDLLGDLGGDDYLRVDIHGVATIRADVLIRALQRGAR